MPPARLIIADDEAAATADDRASVVPLWECAFILAAALLYWTDLLRMLFPGTDGVSAGFRLTHFAFYGAFLVLLSRDLPALGRALVGAPMLVVFLLLPMASSLWSIQPQESLQRSIALMGSCLFAVYLATQVPARLVLRLLAATGLIASIVSFFLIFFVPSVGLMSEGEYVNVWSGAYVHKNGMGQGAMIGAIIALILLVTEGVRRRVWLLFALVVSLALLAGSRSLTAQVVFMASAVLVLTVGRFVRVLVDRFVWFAIFAALLVVVAMATLSIDDVFEWLSLAGKDATMSSRLPLWQSLQPFLADRFWLGHGYESFWGDGSPMMGVIESRVFFKPHYAHNGYIELWLGLGAVGFGLMAALFIRFGVTAVRRLYDDDRDPSMLLALVYVPMFLIQNMAEVTILQRNSMNWILFVWLYLVMVLPRPDRQTADRVHPAEVRMAEIDRRLLVH